MPSEQKDTIALLHGIGQHKIVMTPLDLFLRAQGFDVINIQYPSVKQPIDRLTAAVHRELNKSGAFDAPRLHFVTHSMGGLVLRAYLSRHRPENLGRVVMLAPPNRGSEVADFLKDVWLFKSFFGPAGQELTTLARSAWAETQVDFELGVIAGDNRLVAGLNEFIMKEPNDGLVSVESTKIHGMKDHLVTGALHATIIADPSVWTQITRFIQQGRFISE